MVIISNNSSIYLSVFVYVPGGGKFSETKRMDAGTQVECNPTEAPCYMDLNVEKGVTIEGPLVLEQVPRRRGTAHRIRIDELEKINIINDPMNPPLTPEEKLLCGRQLVQAMTENQFSDSTWLDLAALIHRKQPEKFQDLWQSTTMLTWQDLYQPFKVVGLTNDSTQHAIRSGPIKIECYWRALDRICHGRVQAYTVKYTFSVSKTGDWNVLVSVYFNEDEDHSQKGPYRPSTNLSGESIRQRLVEFVSAGNLDVTCHLEDTRSHETSDFDSEWSSQEILVYIPLTWGPTTQHAYCESDRKLFRTLCLVNLRMKARLPSDVLYRIMDLSATGFSQGLPLDRGALAARIHRVSIVRGSENESNSPPQTTPVYPDVTQSALLSAVDELVGIGRVIQFSGLLNGEDEESWGLGDTRISKAGQDHKDCNDQITFNERFGISIQPFFLESP